MSDVHDRLRRPRHCAWFGW